MFNIIALAIITISIVTKSAYMLLGLEQGETGRERESVDNNRITTYGVVLRLTVCKTIYRDGVHKFRDGGHKL